MIAVGSQLGPYQVLAPLGAGGMGEVWRARDSRLDRDVAVKVLPPQFAGDADRLARFEREAKAVAALSHPNILAIHDYGTDHGVCYAVMELLEGETLRRCLADGPLPWRKVVEIGAAVADGLAAAHAKGIVHRDIKPENLFVTTDDRVKVLDFGLARVEALSSAHTDTKPYTPAQTETGAVMGTVGYMSPEQVRGQTADARSDIFALGCVLYEMVSGQRPFTRETAAETQTAILREEPPELSRPDGVVPLEVERVIRHCLEKNRAERFQTARDLAFSLRALLTDSARNVPVSATPVPVAAAYVPTQTHPQVTPAAQRTNRFGWVVLLTVGLALFMAAVVIKYGTEWFPSQRDSPSNPSSRSENADGTRPAKEDGQRSNEERPLDTVAVLPFDNQSTDAEAGYLGDDITFSLTESLGRFRDLKVRPFSSASRYKKGDKTPVQAGRELQARVVLTGTIQKRGDDLVIFVELVDVGEDRAMWKNAYRGKFAERLLLQRDIVRDLPEQLRLTLTGAQMLELVKPSTNSLKAHEFYVRGRIEWNRRTGAAIRKAGEYFRQAVEADPGYALAYAGLADYYCVSVGYTGLRPKDGYLLAKAAADKALALDSRLAEAYTTLGILRTNIEFDWAGAGQAYRQALALKPNYATARQWHSMYLSALGRHDEAIQEARLAQDLDPDSPVIAENLGGLLHVAGRTEEAIRHLRAALPRHGQFAWLHQVLGLAYLEERNDAEALRAMKEAVRLDDDPKILAGLAVVQAAAGQREEARQVLSRLAERAKGEAVSPLAFALVHAALGEKDQALTWLERSYEERSIGIVYLRVDRNWAGLRSEPRFQALVKKMNFPP